mmetsp:Transcript_13531/g.29272  ORF Transcript_13531/g.29272 Transcript_13531/m.29272 type:complete len:202 (-) Transcript_13531:218-823(-)
MWASVSWLVTSHSDPALRTFPYTSVKVRAALRCRAVSPSITSFRTCATTTSKTSGTKAPVLRQSHSSPARRVTPVRSLYSRVAWRRSAALGRTWIALIICCTTSSSALGTYVVSPVTNHSSPATRPSKSRRARTRIAWSAGITRSGVGGSCSFSLGYSGKGSGWVSAVRISRSPCRTLYWPCLSSTGWPSVPFSTGFSTAQ